MKANDFFATHTAICIFNVQTEISWNVNINIIIAYIDIVKRA